MIKIITSQDHPTLEKEINEFASNLNNCIVSTDIRTVVSQYSEPGGYGTTELHSHQYYIATINYTKTDYYIEGLLKQIDSLTNTNEFNSKKLHKITQDNDRMQQEINEMRAKLVEGEL